MDMIVDMVNAEAVVSRTAGAVPELQARILGIRPPADGALVMVKLLALLLSDPLGSLAEVNGGTAGPARKIAQQCPGKENHEVQNRNNGKKIDGERF